MSSPLGVPEVERIAALAHLALTDEEKQRFARQLADILTYAEQVQQVDTTGVPPTSHTLLPRHAMREDAERPSLDRDAVMGSAPDAARQAGLFRVPKVIGG